MNKLLMAALIAGSLIFMPAAEAAVETYTGEESTIMGDDETPENAMERARLKAIRNALEKAGVYITSQSVMKDFELLRDEVKTRTGAFIKVLNSKHRRAMNDDGAIQIFMTVVIEVETDTIEKPQPHTPIDRPKPLEPPTPEPQPEPVKEPEPVAQPKPPVEQPKPEPVVQPKPPVEQPKPKPEPVKEPEPPKPVEPIKPPVPVEPIKPPTPVEPVTPTTSVFTDEQSMVSGLMDAINAERAKVGKQPLTRDINLVKGAKVRVEELTRTWSHKRPNGSNWWTALIPSYQNKSMWEYIHSGYESPQEVIAWYAQQADNKTLSGDYKTIGIAYLYKADSVDKYYWVIILGN